MYISEHVWEYKKATLIKVVKGTMTESEDEGLLIVTATSVESGEEKNGTVCDLNWRAANLFCQSMGFIFAEWGYSLRNKEFFTDIK